MSIQHKLALPSGHIIDKYRIESVLGYGGFGIVYKAMHQTLEQYFAIKEYLPQEIATREGITVRPLSEQEAENYQYGKERFLAEAKQLAGFRHTNIVGCNDFIEANGTAYLVMDFESGLSLSELLRSRKRQGKPLSEDEIKRIILPLLDGLAAVHARGVLHRDIKPANIFIRRSTEQPVLIDFGSAKQGFSERSKSMAPYTEGYAAMEQIEEAGNLGPWTDIYALGAVMWRIIADKNPPKVESRISATVRGKPEPLKPAVEVGKGRYSQAFLQTIDKCVEVKEEDRYQSAKELQQALSEETTEARLARQDAEQQATSVRTRVVENKPMSFFAAIKSCFKIKTSGRACRREFWWFQLYFILGLVAFSFLLAVVSAPLALGDEESFYMAYGLFSLVFLVWAIISAIQGVTVTIRRFHDVGISGWWLLLIVLFWYLGFVALIVIALLPGYEGENRYGPNPQYARQN